MAEKEDNVQATFDEDGVQASSAIGPDGKEYPDPVPMAPPLGYNQPPDIMSLIRQMIQSERVKYDLEAQGLESFEEADDFDIEDDPLDPMTPYEEIFFPKDAAPPAATPVSIAKGPQEAAKAVEAGVSSPPPGSSPAQSLLDPTVLGDTKKEK